MGMEADAMVTLRDVFQAAAQTAVLDIEGAKLDFAIQLERLISRSGLSRKELAERLGVSLPMVTKILRGDANLTIGSMVRAAKAANGVLHINLAAEGCEGRWLEIVRGRDERTVPGLRYSREFFNTAPSINNWNLAANDHENESIAA